MEPGVDTRCKTCRHPERAAVDAALVDGVPERRIAGRFRLSPASVHRHREHVGQLLGPVPDAGLRASLADRVHRLTTGLEALAEDAWGQGNAGVYLLAVRELRSCYELLGRATGELTRRDSVQAFAERELGCSLNEAKSAIEVTRSVRDMERIDLVRRAAGLLRDYCIEEQLDGLSLPAVLG